MNSNDSYMNTLRDQCARWPKLNAKDLTKALYQAEFGPGHFIANRRRAREWLISESRALADAQREIDPPLAEPLGDNYCRVHLSAAKMEGLSLETLLTLFILSAKTRSGDMEHFKSTLSEMESLIQNGELPVDKVYAEYFLALYRNAGCPSTHHSNEFREYYKPAYRVIRAEYARFLPLFCAIDRQLKENKRILVAVEGGSASGKSTLGELLTRVYRCNLFHMDDFFLQPHQRTPERFGEPGGNVDYERFRKEVITPLKTGKPFFYRVFDCSQMALGKAVQVRPRKLNIVEGAYSMHLNYADEYTLSCLIDIDENTQSERILARNGEEMHRRFINEWIPLEKKYFEETNIRARCTMIL